MTDGSSRGMGGPDGPRPNARGWASRVAHGTIFIVMAFALAIVTTPLLAVVIAGLETALGAAPATKDVVFLVWIPAIAIATVWCSRRINRWLDQRVGRADKEDADPPVP